MTDTTTSADPLVDIRIADVVPVSAAVEATAETALGLGVPASQASRLAAVVRELLGEARARETFGGFDDPVQVTAVRHGSQLQVTVTDHRMPAVGEAFCDQMSFRLSALGFVSDLTYDLASNGNVARAVIPIPPHASWLDTEQILPHDVERVDDATAAAVVFRPAEPADAVAITRLTFRCYGYTYVDPSFYSPEAIAASLKSGEFMAVVGSTPQGDVVGLQGLTSDADGLVPEFGRLMVDARYRRRHLAERLADDLLDRAKERGIPSAWAECVANHAASQRTVQSAGGVEVGLLLGASPQEVAMAGFDADEQGRRSLVSMVIPLAGGPPRTSYLPEHLIPTYLDLAERLGLQREAVANDVHPDGTSQFHISSQMAAGRARVALQRLAPDALQRIAQEVNSLETQRLGVIYLDIPLSDPAAARAIRIAEERQFFWAALLPDARPDGDVLRMQRLAPVPIDFSHIQTITDHGAAMVEFILSEWRRVGGGPVTSA